MGFRARKQERIEANKPPETKPISVTSCAIGQMTVNSLVKSGEITSICNCGHSTNNNGSQVDSTGNCNNTGCKYHEK